MREKRVTVARPAITQRLERRRMLAVAGNAVLLADGFGGVQADAGQWYVPPWSPATFIGTRTQLRVQPNELPVASDGALHLRFDTHNPSALVPGDSFYGQEIISNSSFARGSGLVVEFRARIHQPMPGGIVIGAFLYAGGALSHDEIDFEMLSNDLVSGANYIRTNSYSAEPQGEGHPQTATLPGFSLADYHVYRIEWLPGQVRWLVDDTLVRTETAVVPAGDMSLYLNTWGPGPEWPAGYDAGLNPVSEAAQNATYYADFDWITVSQGAPVPLVIDGTAGNDDVGVTASDGILTANVGGESADYALSGIGTITVNLLAGDDTLVVGGGVPKVVAYGGDGNDTMSGGDGNDTMFAGAGNDLLYGGVGHDALRGEDGNDTVYGELGDDRLYGDKGLDLLYGGDGADRLDGGTGNDTLLGGRNQDVLMGMAGYDLLSGEDGKDTLLGGDQKDTLNGGNGWDSMDGGLGDDDFYAIDATMYADTVVGGGGNDLAHVNAMLDVVSGVTTILYA